MKKELKRITILTTVFVLFLVGFSTIIYARFTRQYNPEVSSFGVSVSSQENMLISQSGEAGSFHDSLKFEELVSNKNVTLTPLVGRVKSSEDGTYKPFAFVDDGGSENLTLNDGKIPLSSNGEYLAFDLYFMGSSDMNLYLSGSTSGSVVVFDDDNVDHSFTQAQRERLMANIRVAFLTYSTTYQPSGTGTNIVYSDSPIATNVYATSVIETDNYKTFSRLGYHNTSEDTLLAATKANEISKIRVVIWLEKDDLGDLEAICKLTLSLRFEAVKINN